LADDVVCEGRPGTALSDGYSWRKRLFHFLIIAGPGLMVMLADTDVGSIVTAAQSGAQWGYRLLWLQMLLIPILYLVQEMTVRLALATHKGHGDLIKEQFGVTWSWISVGTLFLSAIGALVTEFSGLSSVGTLFHVSPVFSVGLAVVLLLVVVISGSYRKVELVGICVGLFELSLVISAVMAHPDLNAMRIQFFNIPLRNGSYLNLLAANIGAVIMPWMIFYQQGAIVDKDVCLSCKDDLKCSRWDTGIGSIMTQLVMAAVLVVTAATLGRVNPDAPLDSVGEIARALTPLIGGLSGKILFAVGVTGAALVASIVVSLAAAWGFGELLGVNRSLNMKFVEAPWFYVAFALGVIAAGLVVLSGLPLVNLCIGVEILNSLLLPVVLGFLILLAFRVLTPPFAMRMWEKVIVVVVYFTVVILGVVVVLGLI